MKIFILDSQEVGLDFALRCKMAGHEVRLYQVPGKHPNIGKGLINKVHDWRPHMRWADLIYFTGNSVYREELDRFFKMGFPIFGTNPAAARLELDRTYGMEVLAKCGIPCAPYKEFSSLDDAEKYVLETDKMYVVKPCKDVDRALSYVPKSKDDLIYTLRKWKKQGKVKFKFILQEFIKGTEFAAAGWFGPNGWSGVWEESFEHKKFMNGETGMNTGEMGTALKYVQQSQLAEEVLLPLTPVLHALNFVGNCDVSVMLQDDGTVSPLEFTIRAGWPASFIQTDLHKGDPAEWMLDLINGIDSLKVSYDHAIGVVLLGASPDAKLPMQDESGTPIYGINEKNFEHIHLGQVRLNKAPYVKDGKVREDPTIVTAGDYLGCIVGRGANVSDASEQAYKRIKELIIPNSPLYRLDIGHKLKDMLPKLKKFGYAEEWEYD